MCSENVHIMLCLYLIIAKEPKHVGFNKQLTYK